MAPNLNQSMELKKKTSGVGGELAESLCYWKLNILLMEEILHHLGWLKTYK